MVAAPPPSSSPDLAQAANARGMAALGRGAFREAAGHFGEACGLDPAAPPLWLNLASAQRGAGDDAGEEASLLRAIAIDQRAIMAHVRLAELHERRGQAREAAQRWSIVLGFAAGLADRPPALEALVRRAEAAVAAQTRDLAAAVDEGLADTRARLSARETQRFDACIDTLFGRRRIYANECAGVHFPFLPAVEYFDRDRFPWAAQIEAHTAVIADELRGLIAQHQSLLTPYVAMEPGTPENKWSALDNKLDWSALHLWRHGEPIAEAQAACPATAAALAALPLARMPRRAPTAFFSVLQPRTHIPPHTGVTNVRTIIHLPLIVPDDCRFRVGGETREWRVGEILAFDDTIEHEAWNDSDEWRAVLIFDVWNPYLSEAEQRLLAEFFDVAERSGQGGAGLGFGDG